MIDISRIPLNNISLCSMTANKTTIVYGKVLLTYIDRSLHSCTYDLVTIHHTGQQEIYFFIKKWKVYLLIDNNKLLMIRLIIISLIFAKTSDKYYYNWWCEQNTGFLSTQNLMYSHRLFTCVHYWIIKWDFVCSKVKKIYMYMKFY